MSTALWGGKVGSLTCYNISVIGNDMRRHIKNERLAGLPADLVRELIDARQ
jgi:hypothetical protein